MRPHHSHPNDPCPIRSSCINLLNLVVCCVGSKLFGRASTLILGVVFVCTAVTVGSFFRDETYSHRFEYNKTDDCVPALDNASLPNCTHYDNGEFTGFAAADGEGLHLN